MTCYLKVYDRCGDCGGDAEERKLLKLRCICDDCWERRNWLVINLSKITEYFGMKEFKALQRSMAYKGGTAKRKILKMMKELPANETSNGD